MNPSIEEAVNLDSKPIEEMDKNELSEYALANFAVELDLHQPINTLREQVKNMASKDTQVQVAPMPSEVTHLKHPVNHRIYIATPELWRRGDMIPCDKEGKPVAVSVPNRPGNAAEAMLRAENAALRRDLNKALAAIERLSQQFAEMTSGPAQEPVLEDVQELAPEEPRKKSKK